VLVSFFETNRGERFPTKFPLSKLHLGGIFQGVTRKEIAAPNI
jgi:hypothetical protein